MKTKLKGLSLIALALCTVLVFVCMMAACGAPDYSTYTYSDWAKMTDKDWDSKTLAYQVETPELINAAMGETHNKLLYNFYDDGTVLILQAGLYTTDPGMDDAAWFDQERHISWAYFGFWELGGGFMGQGKALKLYTICMLTDADVTVPKENADKWASSEEYKFRMEILGDDENSLSLAAEGKDGGVVYLGANTKGEMINPEFDGVAVKVGDACQYKTIQSWVDTYINGTFPQV